MLPSSGVYDFTMNPTGRMEKLTAIRAGAWLGEIRREQPLFSRVAVIDLEIEGLVPLMMLVEDWARRVGAQLQFISPATLKRLAKGPYATRREILEWAADKTSSHSPTTYEQAAAIAGFHAL